MSDERDHREPPRGVPGGIWARITGVREGGSLGAMGIWTDEASDNLVVVCAAPAPEILALARGWVGVQPEPSAGRVLMRFHPTRIEGAGARAGYRLSYSMSDDGHRELWARALHQRVLDTLWLSTPQGAVLVRDVLDLAPVSAALDSALGA